MSCQAIRHFFFFYEHTVQVYGRKLTALILDAAHSHQRAVSLGSVENRDSRYDEDDGNVEGDDDDDAVTSSPRTLPFGDGGRARLFSVRCNKPK